MLNSPGRLLAQRGRQVDGARPHFHDGLGHGHFGAGADGQGDEVAAGGGVMVGGVGVAGGGAAIAKRPGVAQDARPGAGVAQVEGPVDPDGAIAGEGGHEGGGRGGGVEAPGRRGGGRIGRVGGVAR